MFREVAYIAQENGFMSGVTKRVVQTLVAVGVALAIPQMIDASGNGIIATCQGTVGLFGEPHARNAFVIGNYSRAMNELPTDIRLQFVAGRIRMKRSQLGPLSLRTQSVPGVDPSRVARGCFVSGISQRESGNNTPTKP